MKAFILLLPMVGLFAITFYVGYTTGQRAGGLKRKDRRELGILRNQQYRLMSLAAQHMVLGDTFAAIVGDEIETTRRELSK